MASTKQQVQQEIEAVRDLDGLECRVIERVGDFQFVISLRCGGLTVKLQLTDDYPAEAPCVSVRSDGGDAAKIESQLASTADSLRGSPMLAALAEAALRAAAAAANDAAAVPQQKQQQQQQQQRESWQRKWQRRAARQAQAEATGGKLKSMKTADDVIKRIQWDESIPHEDITIGYVDRFKGLVEKPFDSFSWEDIASVDYYTFVIPRHRISHFRYRRAVVWDKRRRLDLVFGSSNAPPGSNIRDFIANYRDEDHQPPAVGANDDDDESASDDFGDEFCGSDGEDFDSGDSDDGVEVRLDRRLVGRAADGDSDADFDDDNGVDDGRCRRAAARAGRFYANDLCRPNFFVCVRVTSQQVAAAVQRLQRRIVSEEPLYQSCCVQPPMLHCTLMTLRLDSAEQIADCAATLTAAAPDLRHSLPHQPLVLRGTGCFHGRVLHAKVEHNAEFLDFVQHLQAAVRSAGHPVLETHEFVPHVTIMKTSRPVSRQLGSSSIPQYLYAGSEDTEFGQQAVTGLYLCSMEKERGPDGFYVTPGCVQFERQILQVE